MRLGLKEGIVLLGYMKVGLRREMDGSRVAREMKWVW